MRAVALALALIAPFAAAQAQGQSALDAVRDSIRRSDWVAARGLLEPMVQARDPRAMVLLADLHFVAGGTGEFAEDATLACGLYEGAAALGAPDGLFGLARCFVQGRGRPRDFTEAVALLERAGDKGSPRAWCAAGKLYFDGNLGAPDPTRGIALCRQGSAMGDGDADAEIGLRLLQGRGMAASFVEARPWLERGAQRGNGAAARALSEIYAQGKGVPRNVAQAMRFLELAAKAGDIDSTLLLSQERLQLLTDARDIESDQVRAADAMYWMYAVAQFHPSARIRSQANYDLDLLRMRFPSAQMRLQFRLENDPPRRPVPR